MPTDRTNMGGGFLKVNTVNIKLSLLDYSRQSQNGGRHVQEELSPADKN